MSLSTKSLTVTNDNIRYYTGPSDAGTYFTFGVNADGLTGTVGTGQICRDLISAYWDRVYGLDSVPKKASDVPPHLGFIWPKLDVVDFAARWAALEETLDLTDRSTLHRVTDHPHAVIIHFSPFWLANDTVRSLATLFMRMIAVYPRDTLTESINAYPLARQIGPTIRHFLAGHTHPTYETMTRMSSRGIGSGAHLGVVAEFYRRGLRSVKRMLIKPPGAAKQGVA